MPVYDDQEQQTNTGIPSDEELRRRTGISEDEEGAIDRDAYNDTANDLGEREEAAASGKPKDSAGTKSGLYNAEGDEPTSRLGRLRQGARNRLNKLGNGILKHKIVAAIVALGGGTFILTIIVILIILSSLTIPHLVENVTSYQFARTFIQATEENNRVVSQKIAVDAADQTFYGQLKAKYAAASGKVSEQWSKLDKFRPNKVIQNMAADESLKFNYKTSTWGGQRLTSITVKGVDHTVTNQSALKKRLIPGYKFVGDVKTASIFQDDLSVALRSNQIGPITRLGVAKQIRQELGISLGGWLAAKYINKTPTQAELLEARDAHTAIRAPNAGVPSTDLIAKAKAQVQAADEDSISSNAELKQRILNGGRSESVEKALTDSVTQSGFQKALGVANSTYAVMVPVCIVYDGSIASSGPTIDAESNAQIKEYQYAATRADQQKDGLDANANAIGAFANRIGDDSGSVPLQRNGANPNISTASSVNAQQSASGTFTLANVLFGGLGGVVNAGAEHLCPKLTNTGVAVGITVAQIVAAFFTGGGSEAGAQAAGNIATRVVGRVVANLVEHFGSKEALKLSAGKAAGIVKDAAKKTPGAVAKIGGITLLAKFIVAHQSGYFTDGVDTGNETANNVDAGGNLLAQQVNRRQFYGRPLDQQEVNAAAGQTQAYLEQQNAGKSAYQRYFALSNPSSLLTTFGTSLSTSLRHFSLTSLFTGLTSKLTSPAANLTALMGNNRQLAYAINTPNGMDSNYSNVQIGWSKAEEELRSQPSYSMLENQSVLDASGKEDEIASKYGKCFDSTSMGTLLSEGDITRDDTGNVVDDQGDCSPQNLGPHNPTYGDLVFRYRVAGSDNIELDNLADEQTITESDTTTEGTGGNFNIASFNIQGASHTDPGVWKGRADKTVQTIKTKKIGIVGGQEMQSQQRPYIVKALGYKSFPSLSSPDTGNRDQNSILWDPGSFTQEGDGGFITGAKYFCAKPLDVPYVKLQTTDTQQEFYVINTHDPASNPNKCGADQSKVERTANAKIYAAFIKQLKQKDDLPVFMTGDFNSGYTVEGSGANGPLGGVAANLTYCIMTQGGQIDDAYDSFKKRDAKCPNDVAAGDQDRIAGGVDHVFMTNDVKATDWVTVPGGQAGTDHKFLQIYSIALPGSDTPAANQSIGGVKNFRDASDSNNVLKSGVLYRSGDLSKLTSDGSKKLASTLGSNSTIIDLRTSGQRQAASDKAVNNSRTIDIPMEGVLDQGPMVTDPVRRSQMGKALTAAANAKGNVLIHCTAGKDRTGWAVAMIMYNAGANDQQVMNEYMKSADAFPDGVKQAWLNDGLTKARNQYGSINGYLKRGLGLSDSDLTKLRNKFKAD